jgi:hypothetical protein
MAATSPPAEGETAPLLTDANTLWLIAQDVAAQSERRNAAAKAATWQGRMQ